jgi:hypothetical protein
MEKDPLMSTSNTNDPVNNPSHYGGVGNIYQPILVAEAWGFDKDTYLFQVLRYIARAGKKNPDKFIEDLEKGEFYLKRRIRNAKQKEEVVSTSTSSGGGIDADATYLFSGEVPGVGKV